MCEVRTLQCSEGRPAVLMAPLECTLLHHSPFVQQRTTQPLCTPSNSLGLHTPGMHHPVTMHPACAAVDYLGKEESNLTMNFSRPGAFVTTQVGAHRTPRLLSASIGRCCIAYSALRRHRRDMHCWQVLAPATASVAVGQP